MKLFIKTESSTLISVWWNVWANHATRGAPAPDEQPVDRAPVLRAIASLRCG